MSGHSRQKQHSQQQPGRLDRAVRIILDITRLLLRSGNSSPTGIDRVELAYLARLLDNPHFPDIHFVVTTHVACGTIPQSKARQLFERLMRRWVDHVGEAPRHSFRDLVRTLEAPVALERKRSGQFGFKETDSWSPPKHARLVRHALAGYLPLWKLLLEARRLKTCYLHLSHVCLEHRYIFRWLNGGHIKSAIFLHDIIPLDYPEYCGENAHRKHLARVKTATEIGHAIIVNSRYTEERLMAAAQDRRLACPDVLVSPLGTQLEHAAHRHHLKPVVPYFVHLGTIEARKNIALLLNVWRELRAANPPDQVPRLVLAGRRGWQSQSVFDALDRSVELAPYIIEASGLNDSELAVLMGGAAGVLAPSFVEGFGLAGAEALVRGVPVVASDIAAHREVLGDAALLINPIDGLGWASAIRALAWSPQFHAQRVAATNAYQPRSWTDHVDGALDQVIPLLETEKR